METKEKKMLVQRTKRMAGLFVAVLTMLCSLQMTVFAESGKAEVAGKVYEFEKDTPKAINRKKLVAFFLPINYQKGEVAHERRIGKAETQTVCCGAQADRSQAQGEAIAERAAVSGRADGGD